MIPNILLEIKEYLALNMISLEQNSDGRINLGFKVGGRYMFSQRSLENIYLPPEIFEDLI